MEKHSELPPNISKQVEINRNCINFDIKKTLIPAFQQEILMPVDSTWKIPTTRPRLNLEMDPKDFDFS